MGKHFMKAAGPLGLKIGVTGQLFVEETRQD